MDGLELVRLIGSVTTVTAVIMVAANVSPKVTALGFIVFVISSIAWMIDGWLDGKTSLLIQSCVLLLVNFAGVIRWLPRAVGDDS